MGGGEGLEIMMRDAFLRSVYIWVQQFFNFHFGAKEWEASRLWTLILIIDCKLGQSCAVCVCLKKMRY